MPRKTKKKFFSYFSFGERLDRLNGILGRLGGEPMPLDDALKIFEEGVELVREGEQLLQEAEQKVTFLTGEAEALFENSANFENFEEAPEAQGHGGYNYDDEEPAD